MGPVHWLFEKKMGMQSEHIQCLFMYFLSVWFDFYTMPIGSQGKNVKFLQTFYNPTSMYSYGSKTRGKIGNAKFWVCGGGDKFNFLCCVDDLAIIVNREDMVQKRLES